jgi:group I intron endonuclease
MIKKPGIYVITNLVSGKRYIGQTVNLSKRLRTHRSKLNRGYHANPHLQNSWDKYGEDSFSFGVIELCEGMSKEEVTEREQYWTDYYKANRQRRGYNIRKIVDSNCGIKNGPKTQETKEKIRKANEGEKSHLSKLTEEKVKQIFSLYRSGNTSLVELSDKFNVSVSTIHHIMQGRTWAHLDLKIPEEEKEEIIKSRQKRGAIKISGFRNHNSKLSEEEIVMILNEYKPRICTVLDLAEKYSVSRGTIENIVYGKHWYTRKNKICDLIKEETGEH